MSDIALHGLEAMLRGALLSAVVAPAGLWAAWRAGAGLPRRRRIGLAVAAGYGGVALAAIAYAPAFESMSTRTRRCSAPWLSPSRCSCWPFPSS